MTKQILFVQGGGEGAHDEWDDKLVASLGRALGPGYAIRYPRMPHEADPSYPAWKRALAKEIEALDAGAIAIGHSIGATILINVLAELETASKLSAVFLIAPPFVGEGGWPSDDIAAMGDLGSRLPSTVPICLFQGDNDDTTPPAHAEFYAEAIPRIHICRLEGRDHQLNNDLSEVAEDVRALT
jgi:predicted alpha/beta hydrolase family esterase